LARDSRLKAAAASMLSGSVRPQPNLMRAIAWTMLSVVAFTLTAWSGREAGKHMTAMNMVFWRNFISLLILLAAFRWLGISLVSLWPRRPWLHWGRALIHICGQWTWMSALLLIPLIELMALEFTFPLWVALLAPLLLGEKLTRTRIMAAVLGFIGVLTIILGPAMLSGGRVAPSFNLGTMLALMCAVFFAINMITTRYLVRYDGPLTLLMFMVVNHSVMAFILGIATVSIPTGTLALWVLLLGVSSLVAHFALARALAYADTVVVAPLDFVRIPLLVALGVLVYDEPLQAIAVVGAALVLAGNGINIWNEHKAKTEAKPRPQGGKPG
jgi:drug/metabolite transporter (DMT)-like permease